MKLLLVDSQVKGYENIQNAVVDDVRVITYDSSVDTYDSILSKFSKLTELTESYNSVGLVFHFIYGSTFQFLKNEESCNVSKYETFEQFGTFLSNLNTNTIDLITCNLFMYSGWKKIILNLEKDLSINIRASNNETGNFGDWVMESDIIDIKNVYFTEDISKYVGSLGTSFIANSIYIKSNALNDSDPQLLKGGSVYVWGDIITGGATTYNGTYGTIPNLNNVIAVYSTQFAFAALLEDRSVYIWGDPEYGGSNIYPDPAGEGLLKVNGEVLYGVKTIRSNFGAFVAILEDDTLCVWGNPGYGGSYVTTGDGSPTIIPGITGTSKVYSSASAFTVITNTGTVWTWGYAFFGSTVIYGNGDAQIVTQIATGSVSTIQSNQLAFAALLNDGTVFVWGSARNGGSGVRTNLTTPAFGTLTNFTTSTPVSGVIEIFSTVNAFAGLLNDGTVFVWGRITGGGSYIYNDINSSYIIIPGLTDVKTVYSTNLAFAALTNSGDVWVWGDPGYGGSRDNTINPGKINGIVSIKSISATEASFAAITTSNDVYVWGNKLYGGSPTYESGIGTFIQISELSTVKEIYATRRAYAALTNSGDVWVWGNPDYGGAPLTTGTGNITEYTELNGTVDSIYSNFFSFVSLKKDGTLQVWGDPDYGGDQTQVESVKNPSVIRNANVAYAAIIVPPEPIPEEDDTTRKALFISVAAVAAVAAILMIISVYYFSFAAPYIAVFGIVAVIILFVLAMLF